MITFETIYQARSILHNLIMEKWLSQDVFSAQWWGIVAIIVFSYIFVFSIIDKKRFTQILLFGSLMAVSITTYDLFGANFGLWGYNVRLFPVIPGVFLYDYTVIPLYYMLIYQYSPNWKMFLVWNSVFAGFIGLVFLPALVTFEIMSFRNWLPIYQSIAPFVFGLLNRAIVLGTLKAEKNRLHYAPSAIGSLSPQPAMKPTENDEIKDNKDNPTDK
ncbi:hypothetical protein SDC9_83411 [bioreactor metagenome]|uniref:Uncharacterized protein n=1 Tax=bioreactor metagenome TaxID=1076179 RepID=A0A644Z953_9ZZZZ